MVQGPERTWATERYTEESSLLVSKLEAVVGASHAASLRSCLGVQSVGPEPRLAPGPPRACPLRRGPVLGTRRLAHTYSGWRWLAPRLEWVTSRSPSGHLLVPAKQPDAPFQGSELWETHPGEGSTSDGGTVSGGDHQGRLPP